MTNDEAKFLLQAWRPGGRDANCAEFVEAFVQMERDPALKKWFERELQFDGEIAQKVQAQAVPKSLRADILAGARLTEIPWQKRVRVWAIAASVLALACAGGTLWLRQQQTAQLAGWQDQAIFTITSVLAGETALDKESPKVDDLKSWLQQHDAPSPNLPGKMQSLVSLGCKTIHWHGKPVSIVCFHRSDGKLVHLVTIEKQGLANPPPLFQPTFVRHGEWATVSWSEDKIAVMVFEKGSPEALRALLAVWSSPVTIGVSFPALSRLH